MLQSHVRRVIAGCSNAFVSKTRPCITLSSNRPTSLTSGHPTWTVPIPPRTIQQHGCNFHAAAARRSGYEWAGIPNFVHRFIDYANPICQACLVPLIPEPHLISPGSVTLPPPDNVERKPMHRYIHIPLCDPCWQNAYQRRRATREMEDRKIADRRKRLDDLLQSIKAMPQGEHVPIRYAVEKLMDAVANSGDPYPGSPRPERWYREYLKRAFEMEVPLRIEKVGARWKCDKLRVDAMDFALHFYRWDRKMDL